VLLMGVAPLMPWRRVSRGKLSRLLLWPCVAGLLVTAGLYAAGVRNPALLPGTQLRILPVSSFYGILTLAATIIVMEFWRGTLVRRHTSGEGYVQALLSLFRRNRRRYGGYLVHLGVLMIALGVIGTRFFEVETQRNLAAGESFDLVSPFTGTYTLTYQGLQGLPAPEDVNRVGATLSLAHNGRPLGSLYPKNDYFIPQEQPMTVPAMRHTLIEDVYVVVAGWEDSGATATFKAHVEPFVNWLWIGGLVFILGTVIAAWPKHYALAAPVQQATPIRQGLTG
jgi:cytochrome c-type biogenesis protein CcmF